jgi:hypothetical protein
MGCDFRARRGLRALVVSTAVVAGLALVAVSTPPADADTATNAQRARRGAQWLANQVRANNGFVYNFGKPDPVNTAYAVIAMRAVGVDKSASDKAIIYLKKRIDKPLQSGGKDSAGALAHYVMASVADAQDPRHFGGTGKKHNLVNRLLATARTSGPDKGLFGSQDPTFDGAFRQGLALAALKAANVSAKDPRVGAGIKWLTNQQCKNGLWQSYRKNPKASCRPADPVTFTGPDTNSTGMAVQGLAAWGKRPNRDTVLKTLRGIQSADAGFPFVAAKNLSSDPNSTALIVQAIIAEKSGPGDTRWRKGTATPYSALGAYQLDCTNPDFGAFWFPGTPTSANTFATVQAVPALAGKAFPIGRNTGNVKAPLTPC